ncbi:hypothetical protein [Deinococcus hopiensis]|uniref:hypothetical protein n=1 Tax=Deinococcus hopiensis TaxID=309885 RepID=UPI00111BFB3C|nr:hypothetical protein [Deinococcus hopiensis]
MGVDGLAGALDGRAPVHAGGGADPGPHLSGHVGGRHALAAAMLGNVERKQGRDADARAQYLAAARLYVA